MSFLILAVRGGAHPDQYLDGREYNDARRIASLLLRASVLVALVSVIF
jgi:hypothetical protein